MEAAFLMPTPPFPQGLLGVRGGGGWGKSETGPLLFAVSHLHGPQHTPLA